jgi:hypothetical protein
MLEQDERRRRAVRELRHDIDPAVDVDRCIPAGVAELPYLDLPVRVLVQGERVEHPDDLFLVQPLELRHERLVEIGALQAQDDQQLGGS